MMNKDSISYMISRTKTAVAVSSFLFLISSLIADLAMGGAGFAGGYSVTKMALGSLGIGLGFGLPCIVYTAKKLSRGVQITLHMTAGCTIMLAIALYVGWIPKERGILPALLAVISMLMTALIIGILTYRRQKKLAERINTQLEQRRG